MIHTEPVTSSDVWVEVIKLVPDVLWLVFAAIALVVFYRPIRDMLPRIGGLKAFGVEFKFIRKELDYAIEKQAAKVSTDDRWQVLQRAKRLVDVTHGALILWVDDHPENNVNERRILRSLGIHVDTATSTADALKMLSGAKYDVVISDMERAGVLDEGIRFVTAMRAKNLYRWTIIYLEKLEPERGTPPYILGITDRPDHLLHFVLDALERERN